MRKKKIKTQILKALKTANPLGKKTIKGWLEIYTKKMIFIHLVLPLSPDKYRGEKRNKEKIRKEKNKKVTMDEKKKKVLGKHFKK